MLHYLEHWKPESHYSFEMDCLFDKRFVQLKRTFPVFCFPFEDILFSVFCIILKGMRRDLVLFVFFLFCDGFCYSMGFSKSLLVSIPIIRRIECLIKILPLSRNGFIGAISNHNQHQLCGIDTFLRCYH